MERELKEACGVIGVWSPDGQAARVTRRALQAVQHRGLEGAGIVTYDDKVPGSALHALRGPGLVEQALPVAQVDALGGSWALGHVRYSTMRLDHADNAQPLCLDSKKGTLALVHNGHVPDTTALLRSPRSSPVASDSALLLWDLGHRLEAQVLTDLPAALAGLAEAAQAAFALAVLAVSPEGPRLFGLKDAFGLRPLVVGQLPGGGFVLASESVALDAVGASLLGDIPAGRIVEVGPQGLQTVAEISRKPAAPCALETIYFSRAESRSQGQLIAASRRHMGRLLAQEEPAPARLVGGMVVPIPESGLLAAQGYAQHSGLPVCPALLARPGIPRTFLRPSQAERRAAVHEKLVLDERAVRGRSIVLVDDSIVRGHTAQAVVALLRAAGATAVHVRVASPPVAWPCFLGIDMPDSQELVAHTSPPWTSDDRVEWLRASLAADSLRYLSLPALGQALGGAPHCVGCLTGRYPVGPAANT